MAIKRMLRDRRLTPEEGAKYRQVREQVAEELPALIERHHERLTALDELEAVLQQLKAAREEKGLSLSDMTRVTGMDRSALSKLETGH
jgi:ribosome-binding protein aMBF1 (putative translation factor)